VLTRVIARLADVASARTQQPVDRAGGLRESCSLHVMVVKPRDRVPRRSGRGRGVASVAVATRREKNNPAWSRRESRRLGTGPTGRCRVALARSSTLRVRGISRHREMKLARLVACAAVARARLVASAAVARSFAQTAADGGELNYLRIAKSGSMSILAALEAANKTTACHGLRSHYHETIARDLPPGSASFAVLRDPCERFVSVFDHLRFKLTGRPGGPELTHDAVTWARALRDDPKERRRWLNVGARGVGHYVEAARRRVVAACVAPMGIAETRRRRGNCEDASWPRGSRRRVAAAGIAEPRRRGNRRDASPPRGSPRRGDRRFVARRSSPGRRPRTSETTR